MKQPHRWPGLVLLTTLMLAGCEHGGPATFDETVRSRITLNLGTPHAATLDGGLQECFSVVSLATLSIDGSPLSSLPVELGGQVSFFAEVDVGLVAFGVEIFSDNRSLLYAGRTRQMIETDGFEVRLNPTAQSPVMEACFEPNTFAIDNRGRGSLQWEIIPPPEMCGVNPPEPCVGFDPSAGVVKAGDPPTTVLFVGLEPGLYQARVTSDAGDIPFTVEIVDAAAR